MSYEDEEDDDLDEREEPEDSDVDDSDSVDTVRCPYCRKPIYEQAEVCPHCDRYISREDAPPDRKPLWIVLTVLACLAAILVGWVLKR